MRDMHPPGRTTAYVTYDDYLRIEQETGIRHEYVGGVLYAMVGASLRHNEITAEIYTALRSHARDAGCRIFLLDSKLRVRNNVIYYPDLMVTCDPADNDPAVVTRPCLVVEVLSPSTERTDEREKLISYSNMPSVLTYLIVSQSQSLITRHWRATTEAADWQTELHNSGNIPLPCPDMLLSMEDVYAAVKWDDDVSP